MNEVLVKLYVPKIEQEYEVWIPVNRRIGSVIKLLTKSVYQFTNGTYNPRKMPELYNKQTAEIYDINKKVGETDIRTGTRLILI